MDKFDDLPDDIVKDTKTKFVTEVNKNPNLNQQVSNLLEPLFEEEQTSSFQTAAMQGADKVNKDEEDVQDADDKIEHPAGQDEH